MKKRFSVMVLFVITVLMLSACAGVSKYNDVFKSSDENAPNIKTFAATPQNVYSAACRALMADNFRIEKQDIGKSVIGAKYWTQGKKMIQLAIEVNVLPIGDGRTTAYASAVQSVNEADVASNFFHLPIPLLGAIPTPIKTGSTITSAQKEEATVKNDAFYRRFFKAVGRELSNVTETVSAEGKTTEKTTMDSAVKKEENITGDGTKKLNPVPKEEIKESIK